MFKRYRYLEAALNDGSGGGTGTPAPAAPAAAAPASGTPAPTQQGSSLGGTPAAELIPEKFRVVGADGKTIDELASLRKVASDGFAPLAKRLGEGGLPPAKPEEYKFTAPANNSITPETFDAFVKDAGTQEFIKAAHAKGFNNDQINFAMEQYLAAVPDLMAGDAKTRDDGTLAYMKANGWKDEAALSSGFKDATRVAAAFAEKTGFDANAFTQPLDLGNGIVLPPMINDPRFLKLAAALAPELGEDIVPANGGGTPGATIDEQLSALQKKLDEMPEHDKGRGAIRDQILKLHERKIGTSKGRVILTQQPAKK